MSSQSEATLLLRIKSAGESVLSKTKSALGDLRTWAAAAFAALTSGAAVVAFKEAEEATNKLNQSLINQGIYTKALSEGYQKMASELESVTTFQDDSIVAAQAQMQSYLGQTKISKELMMATLDLAAAKKMDLASAAEMVAKSIGTSTNALARQGIELEKGATKTEKMQKVISVLNDRYGGMATEQAKGLGSITQMKNAVNNFLEVVGERLAPFIIAGAKAITQLANNIGNSKEFIFWFEFSLTNLAKVAAGLRTGFTMLGAIIMGTFATIYDAMTKLVAGDLKGAWDSVKTGFGDLGTVLSSQYGDLTDDLAAIDDVYVNQKLQKQEDEIANLERSEERKDEIQRKHKFDMEEFFKARNVDELAKLIAQERLKNDVWLKSQNEQIALHRKTSQGYQLEIEKRKYLDKEYQKEKDRIDRESEGAWEFLNSKRVQSFDSTMQRISGLQSSKSGALIAVGKAAALAHITIDTATGAMSAYRSGVELIGSGPGGVIAGGVLAGLVVAEGGMRAGQVAGVALAEGGIVKARPGGVRATIGEGKHDEIVIPLDRAGMGNQINIMVQGGFLGDRQQAREFALALDKELFRLRQSNQSMAFDGGII